MKQSFVTFCLVLLGLSIFPAASQAQPCCYGYRVRYYRVHPNYQVLRPAPTPPRWSIGAHITGIASDQMFGEDPVGMGGVGGHLRLRGYRWGVELAMDVAGGSYLDGRVQRVSAPFQASALLYLVPEGRINLFLIGGTRVTATHISLDLPNLQAEQSFTEVGLHGGVGAELNLSRAVALTGDLRFYGNLRDDNSHAGVYYTGVEAGIVPADTSGVQLNLGVSFRF